MVIKRIFAALLILLNCSNVHVVVLAMKSVPSSIVYAKSPTELMFGLNEISEFEHLIDVCHYGVNKTYMDYKSLSKNSNQYKLLSTLATKNGFFYSEDGFMAAALGSYFGELGEKYIFTLSSGVELKLIKADEKADIHTNNGCEQRWDKSVIEFIIDSETLTYAMGGNGYFLNGNFNNTPEFSGDIVKIVKIKEDVNVQSWR